jgi:hypothetical protein
VRAATLSFNATTRKATKNKKNKKNKKTRKTRKNDKKKKKKERKKHITRKNTIKTILKQNEEQKKAQEQQSFPVKSRSDGSQLAFVRWGRIPPPAPI